MVLQKLKYYCNEIIHKKESVSFISLPEDDVNISFSGD